MTLKHLLLILSFCIVTSAQAATEKPLSGDSLYNLQSSWTTQDSQTINIGSLRGQPVMAAMVYTSCKFMCPVTVEDMLATDREISKKSPAPVRFVLFSMDPAKDTPERLKDFAKAHHLDLKRWTLLCGDDKAVRGLAAALGIRYRRNADGEFEHSGMISLLDSEGVIAYQRAGEQEDLTELINNVKRLIGEPHKP